MKFNCGPTWQEKQQAKEQWHTWFVWFPVRVSSRDCRWLETVARIGKYDGYDDSMSWTYRARS